MHKITTREGYFLLDSRNIIPKGTTEPLDRSKGTVLPSSKTIQSKIQIPVKSKIAILDIVSKMQLLQWINAP
jgi:hypothetical protein